MSRLELSQAVRIVCIRNYAGGLQEIKAFHLEEREPIISLGSLILASTRLTRLGRFRVLRVPISSERNERVLQALNRERDKRVTDEYKSNDDYQAYTG